MTRKFLENLGLEKETIDKIIAENAADIEKTKGSFEPVTKELETLKTQLTDRDKQIETLQNENKLQADAHAAELHKLRIDNAVDKALTASKAKNNTAVRALLKDLDKAEFNDDGTVKGLKKQIDALVKDESTSFLFDNAPPKFSGFQPGTGDTPAVDTSQMTYSQMNAYQAAHPDAKF